MGFVLDDSDIADLRDLVIDLNMPDTFALVEDGDPVPDGAGGTTAPEETLASGPCKLRSSNLKPNERVVAERLGWSIAYAVDLPYDTAVTPNQRLVVDGRTFQIGGVIDSGVSATKKVAICQENG